MPTTSIQLFDCIAALRDFPQHGVRRGDIGTVVEVHGAEGFEIEFLRAGKEPAVFGVSAADVLPVHLSPAEVPLTGEVDVLWYWYDPTDDVLEVRLKSRRGVPGRKEVTPDGVALILDAAGTAVGMVIRGFWARFGAGQRSRGAVEAGVSRVRATLLPAA